MSNTVVYTADTPDRVAALADRDDMEEWVLALVTDEVVDCSDLRRRFDPSSSNVNWDGTDGHRLAITEPVVYPYTTDDGEDRSVALHQVLAGLYVIPSETGTGASQAQKFAALCSRLGLFNEEQLFEHVPALKDAPSASYRFIGRLQRQVDKEIQAKGRQTMKDNGKPISSEAVVVMQRMINACLAHKPLPLTIIAEELHKLTQMEGVDNAEMGNKPLGWKQKLWMDKASSALSYAEKVQYSIIKPDDRRTSNEQVVNKPQTDDSVFEEPF